MFDFKSFEQIILKHPPPNPGLWKLYVLLDDPLHVLVFYCGICKYIYSPPQTVIKMCVNSLINCHNIPFGTGYYLWKLWGKFLDPTQHTAEKFRQWRIEGGTLAAHVLPPGHCYAYVVNRVATKLSRQNSMTFPWLPWPLNRHTCQVDLDKLPRSGADSQEVRICL